MPATKISLPPRQTVSRTKPTKLLSASTLKDSPAFRVLIKQYSDAMKQSQRVGRPVSFRVEVDPAADAPTVTAIEETPMAAVEAFPVEDVGEAGPELQAALTAARERGRQRASEILSGDEMLTAEAFAELLGTSRVTVNSKRQNGQLLGLDGAKRGFRFPTWQLDEDGRPHPVLPMLFERLGRSPWAVYRFLTSPHAALNGRTGLDVIRQGNTDAVVATAESISRGDFR